jgi:hypothetical protein
MVKPTTAMPLWVMAKKPWATSPAKVRKPRFKELSKGINKNLYK